MMSKGEQVQLSKQADAFFFSYKNQSLPLQSDNYDDFDVLEKTAIAKAFIFNNECLLMETTADTTKRVILLADKSNGKVFARYYDYKTP